jgi:hypothetical protein
MVLLESGRRELTSASTIHQVKAQVVLVLLDTIVGCTYRRAYLVRDNAMYARILSPKYCRWSKSSERAALFACKFVNHGSLVEACGRAAKEILPAKQNHTIYFGT